MKKAKKQRSKAELLASLRTHEALKKDSEQGHNLQEKTVFWRMGVIWTTVLWREEKFSAPALAKFLQHMANSDMQELSEQRKDEINEILGEKCDIFLKNQIADNHHKSAIDRRVNELVRYNTEICVNYSLIAVEYLIKNKKYGKKRLYRVLGDVYYLDTTQTAKVLWNMRKDLFETKGIWVSLDDDDKPEGITQIIEREVV